MMDFETGIILGFFIGLVSGSMIVFIFWYLERGQWVKHCRRLTETHQEFLSDNMEQVNEFIAKLPVRINWIKNTTGELKRADDGFNDYYTSFFNIWKSLDYTPGFKKLARYSSDIIYDVLTDHKPLYKHYENPLSYEMSESAKRFYWVSSDIYTYLIWLQKPSLFPEETKKYCERIYNKWIKEPTQS